MKDPNKTWIGLEYFCFASDEMWRYSDEQFIAFAIDELVKLDLVDKADVLDATIVREPKAYPAYFGSYDRFSIIRQWLDSIINFFPLGRNGMHRYNNQDHSMLTAMTAVECILEGTFDKSKLWAVNTEQDFHEDREKSEAK